VLFACVGPSGPAPVPLSLDEPGLPEDPVALAELGGLDDGDPGLVTGGGSRLGRFGT
jgi:hypothetical protein